MMTRGAGLQHIFLSFTFPQKVHPTGCSASKRGKPMPLTSHFKNLNRYPWVFWRGTWVPSSKSGKRLEREQRLGRNSVSNAIFALSGHMQRFQEQLLKKNLQSGSKWQFLAKVHVPCQVATWQISKANTHTLAQRISRSQP